MLGAGTKLEEASPFLKPGVNIAACLVRTGGPGRAVLYQFLRSNRRGNEVSMILTELEEHLVC